MSVAIVAAVRGEQIIVRTLTHRGWLLSGGSLLTVPDECFHISWTALFFKARCLTAFIKMLVF